MPRYIAPRSIAQHRAVADCASAVEGGCHSAEEAGEPGYVHDVLLHHGWTFTRGTRAGCRTGLFRNVAEFRAARPVFLEGLN